MEKSVEALITQYQMERHAEGGWYRRIWLSDLLIPSSALSEAYGGDRYSAGVILYLLAKGEMSAWHRLKSPELWTWLSGGSICLTFGGTGEKPVATASYSLCSIESDTGDHHVVVPPGVWQTAELINGSYGLVSCTMSPAFAEEDWELA